MEAKISSLSASFQNEDKIGLQFYWSKFGTGSRRRDSGFGIRDSGLYKWKTGFLWIDYFLTIFSSLAYAKNNHNTRKPELRTPNVRIPNSEPRTPNPFVSNPESRTPNPELRIPSLEAKQVKSTYFFHFDHFFPIAPSSN